VQLENNLKSDFASEIIFLTKNLETLVK